MAEQRTVAGGGGDDDLAETAAAAATGGDAQTAQRRGTIDAQDAEAVPPASPLTSQDGEQVISLELIDDTRLGATVKSFQHPDLPKEPGKNEEEGSDANEAVDAFIVVVTAVTEGNLAHERGLRRYDQLVQIGETPIEACTDYRNVLQRLRVERPLRLKFVRKPGPPPELRRFRSRTQSSSASQSQPPASGNNYVVVPRTRQEQILDMHVEALVSGSIEEIREVAFHGLAERYRPVYWRILLGLLSPDKGSWHETLQRKRTLYNEYRREFGRIGRTEASPSQADVEQVSTRPSRLKGQGWWEQDFPSPPPRQQQHQKQSRQSLVSESTIQESVGSAFNDDLDDDPDDDDHHHHHHHGVDSNIVENNSNDDGDEGGKVTCGVVDRLELNDKGDVAKKSLVVNNEAAGKDMEAGPRSLEPRETSSVPNVSDVNTNLGKSGDASSASAQEVNSRTTSLVEQQAVELESPLLIAEDEEDEELRETIWKDVQRTHPGFHFFAEARCEVMERILYIYAKLNPAIRYVQGMNELLAPILFAFGSPSLDHCEEDARGRREVDLGAFALEENYEADAFFCLCTVMGEMRDLYMQGMDVDAGGIRGRGQQLMARVRRVDPAVADHLDKLEMNPQFFALRWITTLLSRELPLPDTVRLWDSLFADAKRFDFLLDCCCAMIYLQRVELLRSDFAGALQILQKYPMTDVDEILEVAASIQADQLRVDARPQNTLVSAMAAAVPSVSAGLWSLRRSLKAAMLD
ncbi:TBC1 domain family member 13 [Hondaea fermentalgiana]|uniref:TBC1 domain family member 13 n=1 Tax=Hondaea fermentalgiana TaxID=2315210 RepID=A0A2R5H368_9STRA|nr:TBC1 domain family member 13 [Hondaea fermentalgiana]|eukprot:GBG34854.1 TBC1 domain family member 13 [Hondaea fermentalgiana]